MSEMSDYDSYLRNRTFLESISNTTDNGTISSDYSGDYYYYYFDTPYEMMTKEWQVPVFSYLYSGIALLTILVNILVIYVFAIKRMRSQTTVLLTSLACSDSLICMSVAIYHIYFHLMKHYQDPIVYRWCVIKCVLHILEKMARFSSNWITALLGVQRCICICLPFRARTLCSIRNSAVSVVVTLIVGVSIYIYEAISVEVIPLSVYTNGSIYLYEGCVLQTREIVSKSSVMTNYVITGILARLLPCIVLLVTTVLLALKLKNRKRGIATDVHDKNKSTTKMQRLNILVFLILIIFLLSELQDTIAFCIYIYELASDRTRQVLSQEADDHWDTWGSFLSLLGYHCNFWIFFLMSSQFRSAFYETCSSVRSKRAYTYTKTTKTTFLSRDPLDDR